MRPLQQGLSLAGSAKKVTWVTIGADLTRVSRKAPPALDLRSINIRNAAAQIVTAIPLKPATRIGPDDPAFGLPFRQALTAFDPEEVQRRIGSCGQLRVGKPLWRKLIRTVRIILALKHSHLKHFLRRIGRRKIAREILTFAGG